MTPMSPSSHGHFQPAVSSLACELRVLNTGDTADQVLMREDDTIDQEREEDYESDEDAEFYDWDPSCGKGKLCCNIFLSILVACDISHPSVPYAANLVG